MSGSWIEIDATLLVSNLNSFRRLIGPDRKLMAVVKANAYGHGLKETAPAVAPHADWLGVDSLAEGIDLFELGIQSPLLILGHTPVKEASHVVRYGFRQALFRRDVAEALSRAAQVAQKTAFVHLKVDTGLHRLGVPLSKIEDCAKWLSGLAGICIEGVYTHFANIEDPADSFYRQQIARLTKAVAILNDFGHTPSIVHAAPTAGVLLRPETHLSLVRVGVGIYGIRPSYEARERSHSKEVAPLLKPVLTWKTRLVQVKTVAAGNHVGYDLTYRATNDRRVGVVPVGYADGYDRSLSNRGWALVNGFRVPIVGRVAMNMMMIDVTDAKAEADDEVVLLGEQGTGAVTAADLAKWTDTIPYEVLARIHPAISRKLI